MPLSTASAVTLFYAIGYPVGTLAVTAMTPMAVLVLRFGFATVILAGWAIVAKAAWPRGAQFGHVLVAGLLIQAVQFCCLYEAVLLGAPAVLCAVVIAMNPVITAILAATFLREPLGTRADSRTGPRCRRGARRLRTTADEHARHRSRHRVACRCAAWPFGRRRVPAAVLRGRRLPHDERDAKRRGVHSCGGADDPHALRCARRDESHRRDRRRGAAQCHGRGQPLRARHQRARGGRGDDAVRPHSRRSPRCCPGSCSGSAPTSALPSACSSGASRAG